MKERILKCIHFFTFFFDVCYLYYVKYKLKQIDIYADGRLIKQVKQLKKGGKATEVPLDGIVCEQIDIKIVNTTSEALGIGEIVLLKDTKTDIAVDHRSEKDIHRDFFIN